MAQQAIDGKIKHTLMQYINITIHHDSDRMSIDVSVASQAVVRAMDTVTHFTRRVKPCIFITRFVVAGRSKVSHACGCRTVKGGSYLWLQDGQR